MRLVFDVSRVSVFIIQMIQVIQVSMGRFNPSWTRIKQAVPQHPLDRVPAFRISMQNTRSRSE